MQNLLLQKSLVTWKIGKLFLDSEFYDILKYSKLGVILWT